MNINKAKTKIQDLINNKQEILDDLTELEKSQTEVVNEQTLKVKNFYQEQADQILKKYGMTEDEYTKWKSQYYSMTGMDITAPIKPTSELNKRTIAQGLVGHGYNIVNNGNLTEYGKKEIKKAAGYDGKRFKVEEALKKAQKNLTEIRFMKDLLGMSPSQMTYQLNRLSL